MKAAAICTDSLGIISIVARPCAGDIHACGAKYLLPRRKGRIICLTASLGFLSSIIQLRLRSASGAENHVVGQAGFQHYSIADIIVFAGAVMVSDCQAPDRADASFRR